MDTTPPPHKPIDPAHDLPRTEAALCAPRISPKRLGALGEEYVTRWLQCMGWRILDRNWSCRFGELDIVALDQEKRLVFVEVKTRRSRTYGRPEEAVAAGKRLRLRRAAILWLKANGEGSTPRHGSVRFDVAALFIGPGPSGGGVQARVRLIRGAF
ncbi:YraN family protein [Bifidobacterium xylocopae]|uniref:UPF0102 protein CRD59_00560 n=1 Tax=Bifidobacterium xylocopae TaxID=2493119 RepID=A0A366KFX8_9BIFI|nr:YraN family protein [Bifidobacterium xylocopae]RBP99993.1 YraN family protein [Bifidobacterium xylocopae]